MTGRTGATRIGATSRRSGIAWGPGVATSPATGAGGARILNTSRQERMTESTTSVLVGRYEKRADLPAPLLAPHLMWC